MSAFVEALAKTVGVFAVVAAILAVIVFVPPVIFATVIVAVIMIAVAVVVFSEFYEGAQRRNENRKEWNLYIAEEKARNKAFEARLNDAKRELERLENEYPAPKE